MAYAINSNPPREVSASVARRQRTEYRIIGAFVKDALAAGYAVSVNNGEDETIALTSYRKIMAALMQTDEDRLYVHSGDDCIGWVYAVYGNDGWDVISDYTVNLETVLANANTLADKLS